MPRIPAAVNIESRDGTLNKGSKLRNAFVEGGETPKIRKRPGLITASTSFASIHSGTAQLIYSWNGLWVITGDVLKGGTLSTIYSSPTSTNLTVTVANQMFSAQETGSGAATQRLMIKNRTNAFWVSRAAVVTAIAYGGTMGTIVANVVSLSRTGGTATGVVGSIDPGFNTGDSITIAGSGVGAYNGTFTVTSITLGSFTPAATLPLTITRSGTTATATTETPHLLTTGTTYAISGADQSAYNGSYAITSTGTNTFTYTVTTTAYTAITGTWDPANISASTTLSGGNLTFSATTSASTALGATRGTVSKNANQWYWEITVTAIPDSSIGGSMAIGVANSSWPIGTLFPGEDANSWGYVSTGYTLHSGVITSGAASYSAGDIIGVAIDFTAGTLTFYKNGVFVRVISSVSGTLFPAIASFSYYSGTSTATGNFGASTFAYSYTDPYSPATGSPVLTRPAVTVNGQFTYALGGGPDSATGTITATFTGGTVPGIAYINGYFCVMDVNGVVWNSAIDDPTTWPALNFFTVQNENGAGKAIAKSQNYLIAFKEWSTEPYYDAQKPVGSPFAPVGSGFIQIGCASGDSVASLDGMLYWIGQTRQQGRGVYSLNALQPSKVSTPDIDRILNASTLTTVYTYGLRLSGHSLYLISLYDLYITIVYDATANNWAEWTTLIQQSQISAGTATISRSGDKVTYTYPQSHGLMDGTVVKISGCDVSECDGLNIITVIDSKSFSYVTKGLSSTPTVAGSIYPYTEGMFEYTKYVDFQNYNLVLHRTSGQMYYFGNDQYQDDAGSSTALAPISYSSRSIRLDGGSAATKTMNRIRPIQTVTEDIDGEDKAFIRWSNDDYNTWSHYRHYFMSEERPSVRRTGKFSRRALEWKHIGNNSPIIDAFELEIS